MGKTHKKSGVEIGLNAAIVALENEQPMVLCVREGGRSKESGDHPSGKTNQQDVGKQIDSLPFGHFDPLTHRTMEIGVRGFVKSQTGLDVGYVEQLYTFGDRGRAVDHVRGEKHVVSIGYLALTKVHHQSPVGALWRSWYQVFPWEDWRQGAPQLIDEEIVPRLSLWCKKQPTGSARARAAERFNICFDPEGQRWDEEKALDRYELLYEAGLVSEALRDGRDAARQWGELPQLGEAMMFDHRRILATAMSRIRAKIKYRPVIFDLMQASFTLLQLQRSVEAISGTLLHKQNFRRLVEKGGLVVATGDVSEETGGRPAKLYRFRKEVLLERSTAGVRVRI